MVYSTIIKVSLYYLNAIDQWDSTTAPINDYCQRHTSKVIDTVKLMIGAILAYFHRWDNMRVTRNLSYIPSSNTLIVVATRKAEDLPKVKVTLDALKLKAKSMGVKHWQSYRKTESLQLAIANHVN